MRCSLSFFLYKFQISSTYISWKIVTDIKVFSSSKIFASYKQTSCIHEDIWNTNIGVTNLNGFWTSYIQTCDHFSLVWGRGVPFSHRIVTATRPHIIIFFTCILKSQYFLICFWVSTTELQIEMKQNIFFCKRSACLK